MKKHRQYNGERKKDRQYNGERKDKTIQWAKEKGQTI